MSKSGDSTTQEIMSSTPGLPLLNPDSHLLILLDAEHQSVPLRIYDKGKGSVGKQLQDFADMHGLDELTRSKLH